MKLERSTVISVCYKFISFKKSDCIITVLNFVLLVLFFIILIFLFIQNFTLDFIQMCSFNYLGCISFTRATLTKGGCSAYQFHPFNVYITSESMQPLQHLLLFSLTVVDGKHTSLVNILVQVQTLTFYQGTATMELDCC